MFKNLLTKDINYHIIELNNKKVSYFESFKDKPVTILLIHGFGSTALNFLPLMKELTEYHLIAVDLPARGDSTLASDDEFYRPCKIAQWLHEFVTAIGLKNFHIAAHSMGAHYMFEYAVAYNVLSCISLDGGYLVPSDTADYSLDKEIKDTREYIDQPLFNSEEEYYKKMKAEGQTEESALIDRRLLVERDSSIYFNMPSDIAVNYIKGASSYPDYKLLEKIESPILLLRSDSPEEFNEVREKGTIKFLKHAKAKVIVVKNSTHNIYTSQKEETAEYIREWINNKYKKDGVYE